MPNQNVWNVFRSRRSTCTDQNSVSRGNERHLTTNQIIRTPPFGPFCSPSPIIMVKFRTHHKVAYRPFPPTELTRTGTLHALHMKSRYIPTFFDTIMMMMPSTMLLPATEALLRLQQAEERHFTKSAHEYYGKANRHATKIGSTFPEISWPSSDSIGGYGERRLDKVSEATKPPSHTHHCMVRSKSHYSGLFRLGGTSSASSSSSSIRSL